MDFFQRLRQTLARLMYGRYGSDALGRALLHGSIALLLASLVTGSILSWYLSIAGYGWCLYRMLSRNTERRRAENARYLQKTEGLRRELRQARVRFRNRKQFKYFKCPQCRARMRLTRGCGDKSVTCPRCKHTFSVRA